MNKSSIIPLPTAQHRGGLLALIAVVLWAGFVFVRFFLHVDQTFPYWGRLFDVSGYVPGAWDQRWAIWLGCLEAIVTALFVGGAAWSLGKRVGAILGLDFTLDWTRSCFEMGLGILVLGLFWLGTGLCGLWFPLVGWVLAGGLLLLLATDLYQGARSFTWPGLPSWGWANGFLLSMGLVYLFLSVLVDLTPEVFYDSMVYHLAVPGAWISHHGLIDLPTNFFSNYPYGAELFFLNGLLFQGTESARLLHLLTFVLCAGLAGAWASEISSGKAGLLAFGTLLTFPLFSLNVWTTQVEGFLALALTLAVYSLVRWSQSLKPNWALAAGLFAGLSLAVKYNAALILGAALVALFLQKPDLFRKERWAQWALFAGAIALVEGPWLIKSFVYTGDPFFPYFSGWFHGRHLGAFGYERLLLEQQGRLTAHWWEWFLLPWTIVMSNPDSFNFAGPLALMMAPCLFLFRFKHPTMRFLAWVVVLGFLSGFAVTHILRFMAPNFVLLYVLLAVALAGGDRPFWGKAVTWVAGLCAALCFGYLANIIYYHFDFRGVVSGHETPAQYLSDGKRMNSYQPMSDWLSAHLPKDKRLLIVGDARGLYYTQPLLTNTVFDEQVLAKAAKESPDAQGIAQRLRELGVDVLVVNGMEGMRVSTDYHHYDLTSDEWKRLDEFIQRGTQVVYSQNLQAVYILLPQFRPEPKEQELDLVTLFSTPASGYLKDLRRGDKKQAKLDLDETVKLYPFSTVWKKQQKVFKP